MTQPINVQELDVILQNTISAYIRTDPFTCDILKLMYSTGLRIDEVLDSKRWRPHGQDEFYVNLAKGDQRRKIARIIIPTTLVKYYELGQFNPVYTYSALLWRINQATPIITVNGDTRRTSAHLFRYFYIKDLYAQGYSVRDIKRIIEHKSLSSTSMYVFDQLYLHL